MVPLPKAGSDREQGKVRTVTLAVSAVHTWILSSSLMEKPGAEHPPCPLKGQVELGGSIPLHQQFGKWEHCPLQGSALVGGPEVAMTLWEEGWWAEDGKWAEGRAMQGDRRMGFVIVVDFSLGLRFHAKNSQKSNSGRGVIGKILSVF